MKGGGKAGLAARYSANLASPKPGEYSKEERSRGGLKCAANKRERAHAAIDKALPLFVKLAQMDQHNWGTEKDRFVMVRFVEEALPWLKSAKMGVNRYGAYIKARLKAFEDALPVANLGRLIDKIRAGLARKRSQPTPEPLFAAMKGIIVRVSSNIFRTAARWEGAAWQSSMGIWAYFVTQDGECVS
jgi:hypothetical protein